MIKRIVFLVSWSGNEVEATFTFVSPAAGIYFTRVGVGLTG